MINAAAELQLAGMDGLALLGIAALTGRDPLEVALAQRVAHRTLELRQDWTKGESESRADAMMRRFAKAFRRKA